MLRLFLIAVCAYGIGVSNFVRSLPKPIAFPLMQYAQGIIEVKEVIAFCSYGPNVLATTNCLIAQLPSIDFEGMLNAIGRIQFHDTPYVSKGSLVKMSDKIGPRAEPMLIGPAVPKSPAPGNSGG
jgi:hypothetical protein